MYVNVLNSSSKRMKVKKESIVSCLTGIDTGLPTIETFSLLFSFFYIMDILISCIFFKNS